MIAVYDCAESCAKQDVVAENESNHRHCGGDGCEAILRIEWDVDGAYSLDGESGGDKWFCHRCLIPSETPEQLVKRLEKLSREIPCAAIDCGINTCPRAQAEYALQTLASKICGARS